MLCLNDFLSRHNIRFFFVTLEIAIEFVKKIEAKLYVPNNTR